MTKELAEEEQVKQPSSLREAMENYESRKEKAEKPSEETEETKTETEEPCEECEEETPEETAPKFRFVDEQGKDAPFTMLVDGKEIKVTDPEKLKTYAQLGYHGNVRLEDLNRRETELKKAESFLREIYDASQDGRLSIKPRGGKPSEEEEAETKSEDEETYTDPDILSLRKENKELREEITNLKGFVLGTKITEVKTGIESEIEKLTTEKYPLAKKEIDKIWEILAKKDEAGTPYTVEYACKTVNEQEKGKFTGWLKENPELAKGNKQEIIAEYLKEEQEKAKAPVSSPSEEPTGTPPTSEKKEFKGIKDAMQAADKFFVKKEEAGKKF